MSKFKIYISFLLLSVIAFSCTQVKESKDEITKLEIKAYIDRLGKFTAIIDSANANKILDPYYHKVISFMSEHNMAHDKYYLKDYSIELSNDHKSILIPLRHYDGFKKELELQKVNSSSEMKTTISGNLSGKDGTLEIDLTSNEIIGFKLWQ
jgi:hypothetical protein